MRSPKTDAAVAGTVLLAETLHRLQVPFAVNGFQDVLVPLCDFHEGLNGRVRDAIGEMPQEVEGGRAGGNNSPSYNDDGPCVREAAEQLLNHPADDRMLIVVSDGLPEGRRSNDADLRAAIRDVERRAAAEAGGHRPGPGHGARDGVLPAFSRRRAGEALRGGDRGGAADTLDVDARMEDA